MEGMHYRGRLVDAKFELEKIETEIKTLQYQIELLEGEKILLESQKRKKEEADTMDLFSLLREQRMSNKEKR